MKYLKKKDKSNRLKIKNNYKLNLVLKLVYNFQKDFNNPKNLILKNKFSKLKYKNICIKSDKSRSNNRLLNLARWELKNLITHNNINGIKKSSW